MDRYEQNFLDWKINPLTSDAKTYLTKYHKYWDIGLASLVIINNPLAEDAYQIILSKSWVA